MTIAVAVRTGTAVVFATDSKVTTQGLAGFEQDGTPRWEDQTYDNAIKIVHDRDKMLMAMVAGHSHIGGVSAVDYIARTNFGRHGDKAVQDTAIQELANRMVEEKRAYWSTSKVPEDKWPGPTVWLAAPGPDGIAPRVWGVVLRGPSSDIRETLTNPGTRLDGSYDEAYSLLYGFHMDVLKGIAEQVGIDPQKAREAAWQPNGWLRPTDRINEGSMPLQDAMDYAVFLAIVQVQMDRFLPGIPACGGPIDVMALRMAPEPEIISYPGKQLHHPMAPA